MLFWRTLLQTILHDPEQFCVRGGDTHSAHYMPSSPSPHWTHLSQPAVLHAEPQALSIGQRVAPLGRRRLAGRGRWAVAHGAPPRHHYLAAGLVLVQCALSRVYNPRK